MNGNVFKRCTKCSNRVKQRTCSKCGRSSFTWAFRTYIGKDGDGRWIRRLRGGFATRAEAERALQEVMSSVQRGTFVETSSLTLGDYLRDEWLPATAPPRVKYETWEDRRRNLSDHVIPRVGGVALQELNAVHLTRLYADLLREGRMDGEGGLAPTSVRRIHAMLRKALRDAVRWGRVQGNATDLADPPPARLVTAARRRSMQTWTQRELRSFLDHNAEHVLHTLWVFAASTGVRRSELLGSRWKDMDLRAATVTVRQTLLAGEDGYRLERDQKSISSARTLHLDVRVVAMLRALKETQAEARRRAGPAWHDLDLVFTQPDGRWWNPPAISLAFGRAVKRAGVPHIRLHDLRHTHATLLLLAGVNPKVVSERLGHSSVAFTLDTYAHVMPGMQPEAAALFMDLVYGEPTEDDEATHEAMEVTS